MSNRKLSNKDQCVVEERFQKKMSSWKDKLFSSRRRFVLINFGAFKPAYVYDVVLQNT
jgi:hypothetical protein